MKNQNHLTKLTRLTVACAALMIIAATATTKISAQNRGEKPNFLISGAVRVTGTPLKRNSQIKVTVTNSSSKIGQKIKVTVYAMPPKMHYLGDSTQLYQLTQNVKAGKITPSDLNYNYLINSKAEAEKYMPGSDEDSITNTKMWWASQSQTLDVNPKSAKELVFEMPGQYVAQVGKIADENAFNKVFAISHLEKTVYPGILYYAAPTSFLTFGQSIFYVKLESDQGEAADKKGSYFIDQTKTLIPSP